MQTLFAISRISPIVKDSLEGQPIGHCSSMLYLQLKLVVGKAIRQLEVEILSKVTNSSSALKISNFKVHLPSGSVSGF
jgi:hypothetical protein